MDEGEEGKSVGMARAINHANPAWVLAASKAVVAAAREKRTLTTDDVVTRIDANTTTHELRALGPVMRRAAIDGVIEKALQLPIKCATRPSNHRRPLTVWKSLIFNGKA